MAVRVIESSASEAAGRSNRNSIPTGLPEHGRPDATETFARRRRNRTKTMSTRISEQCRSANRFRPRWTREKRVLRSRADETLYVPSRRLFFLTRIRASTENQWSRISIRRRHSHSIPG